MPPQTAPAAGLSRPHDVRQRIVRGQAVGLARRPVKIVGMGLATTNRLFRIGCHLNGIGRLRVAWRDGSLRFECRVCVCSRPVSIPATQYMGMASQLRFCQRRGFHSAGNIRSWPRRQRLLLGSGRPHDVRQSVVRWQAVGLSRRSRQTVRVGLRSARKKRRCVCVAILRIGLVYAGTVGRKHKFLHRMMMYRQLFPCNGRSADSAGKSAV